MGENLLLFCEVYLQQKTQLLVFQQPFELGLGRLGVAVHQVIADNLLPFAVHVGRMLVHIEDIALGVAHRDGDILQVFEIILHFPKGS